MRQVRLDCPELVLGGKIGGDFEVELEWAFGVSWGI